MRHSRLHGARDAAAARDRAAPEPGHAVPGHGVGVGTTGDAGAEAAEAIGGPEPGEVLAQAAVRAHAVYPTEPAGAGRADARVLGRAIGRILARAIEWVR